MPEEGLPLNAVESRRRGRQDEGGEEEESWAAAEGEEAVGTRESTVHPQHWCHPSLAQGEECARYHGQRWLTIMLPLCHSTTRVQIISVVDAPEVSAAFTHPAPR